MFTSPKSETYKLSVGDAVQHDYSKTHGMVKEIRTDHEGYNYLVDWVDGKQVKTLWCKREVLVKL